MPRVRLELRSRMTRPAALPAGAFLADVAGKSRVTSRDGGLFGDVGGGAP